jgi:maltooligosyltrehalose synthase
MEAKINAVQGGVLSIPISTYRIQFHKAFPIQKALDLSLPEYLKHLGVAYCYSAPLLKV